MTVLWVTLILAAILLAAFWYYQLLFQEKSAFKPQTENIVHLSKGITHYEISGPHSAPIIVLIHGGTIPMCFWDKEVKEFTDAGFRVLRYDQYGRGGSQRLSVPYTREIYSNQLLELLAALKIDKPVHLIGPSFGGAISVSIAASQPQMIKSMVLISPVLNLLKSDSPLVLPIKICSIPLIGDFFFRTVMKRAIINRGQELISCPKCKTLFIDQFNYTGTEYSILSTFRTDAYGDYRKETKIAGSRINHILLVRGKKDNDVTEKMILQVKDDLPNCKFVELEDAGHSPFSNKNSSEFVNVLIDFFKKSQS